MCWMISIWVLRNWTMCCQTLLQMYRSPGGWKVIVLFLYSFFLTENNAYSFGRTTIANLDTQWVILLAPLYHIFCLAFWNLVLSLTFLMCVNNFPFPFISPVINYCGCTPPLHFSTCYWRCTAWDGTPLRCTTKRMTWLVAWFQRMAVLYTHCTHKGLNFVGNYFPVFISMQVKRTLFVNGISKYAEESEIKQHFE